MHLPSATSFIPGTTFTTSWPNRSGLSQGSKKAILLSQSGIRPQATYPNARCFVLRHKLTRYFGEDERADILWVLKAIDEFLARKRNDALHAPLEFLTRFTTEPMLQPRTFPTGNPRALSLAGKDMLNEFAWNLKTSEVLARHVALMDRYFARPAQRTWPERPKLPHLGQKTTPKPRFRKKTPK